MTQSELAASNNKFSRAKRRRLLWRYLKTNFVVTFMLIFEFWRGVFNLFLPKRPKSIEGKVALITGGGHGIGRELALKMAQKGCHIAIADIDLAAAETTVKEIGERFKVSAVAFKADVASYDEVRRLRKAVESSVGCVDILVNNVGLLALDLSLREQTAERIQQVVHVNLMSHFWTVREFLDGMIERNYGHIVASGSFAGRVTLPQAITYSATKYGVTGFMSALYDELCVCGHDDRIKTTTIYPLFVDTSDELAEIAGDFPLWPAKSVARIMLDGMLRDERSIYVPKIAKFSTIMNSFPDRVIKYIKTSNFDAKVREKFDARREAASIV